MAEFRHRHEQHDAEDIARPGKPGDETNIDQRQRNSAAARSRTEELAVGIRVVAAAAAEYMAA